MFVKSTHTSKQTMELDIAESNKSQISKLHVCEALFFLFPVLFTRSLPAFFSGKKKVVRFEFLCRMCVPLR